MQDRSASGSLAGKTAIITGGSRGLGLAMAHALGAAGAQLLITARKPDELRAAAEALASRGCSVNTFCHDVADPERASALVDEAVRRLGTVDVLVSNAGTTWGAQAVDYPPSAWSKVMDVNLNGPWSLIQELARRCLIPQRSGSIILIASILGLGGARPGGVTAVAYHVAKAAQINLTRALAAEWGMFGIRVNCILPGWMPTRMTEGSLSEHGESLERQIPLGRLGTGADLAGPVMFLASDASSYVTGHALVVDGGLSCCL